MISVNGNPVCSERKYGLAVYDEPELTVSVLVRCACSVKYYRAHTGVKLKLVYGLSLIAKLRRHVVQVRVSVVSRVPQLRRTQINTVISSRMPHRVHITGEFALPAFAAYKQSVVAYVAVFYMTVVVYL